MTADRRLLLLSALLLPAAAWADPPAAKPAPVPADHAERMRKGLELFKTTVRPLLAKHCLECHGGRKTQGGFDLSDRKPLMDSGSVGKDAASSRMFRLVTHEEEPRMPHKADKLPAEAIAAIGRWIDLGAPYDEPLKKRKPGPAAEPTIGDPERNFWSFRLLSAPPVPAADADGWARTPIDRFIAAKLAEKKLRPNPAADKRTLLRRAFYDLVGVPPTPAEADAFLNDDAPDAWEKLVDRLLADPRFGERWAPHWLDVARFAESDGFEHDNFRPHAYHYRDFVIRAFNEDMPFDRFVRWQIAGDEYAPDDPQALAATGFLTAGVFPTQITEKEFESTRYDQLDDMVGTTGVAFLGLTVGCARCHDHKFDPIPTRDYYRMVSCFTTAIRSDIAVDLSTSEERRRAEAEFAARREVLSRKLAAFRDGELERLFAEHLSQRRRAGALPPADWVVPTVVKAAAESKAALALQPSGGLLRRGKASSRDTYTLTLRTRLRGVTALRVEALADGSLPQGGPGAAANGNFLLGDLKITAAPADGSAPAKAVKIVSARATHEQNKGVLSAAASFDGDSRATGWAVDLGGIGKDNAACFRFDKPVDHPSGTVFTMTMKFGDRDHALGLFRLTLSSSADPQPTGLVGPEPAIAAALDALAADKPVDAPARTAAREWFAATVPEWAKLQTELAAHEAAGPRRKLTTMQITSEGLPPVRNHADGRGYPHFYRQTHLLHRGDPNNKGEVVTPAYLQVLMRDGKAESHWAADPPAGSRTSHRRRALAEWLTDTRHGAGHLAARVIVNRLWQHHLGRGIVVTPNDFGFQGERPTHPELLDWLAADLVANGWTLKRLHKQILMSAVYRQSTAADAERTAIDPEVTLFWRFKPRRLDAEAVRDSLLAVSGRLDPAMFGPGTGDEGSRRRSVYFRVKRADLVPALVLLDFPERLSSIGSRPGTTISPQALMFLNGPQVRAAAEGLAGRVWDDYARDPAAGVRAAYRLTLTRDPTDRETARALAFLERQTAARSGGPDRSGDARKAALQDFAHALLGLNEFVYVP